MTEQVDAREGTSSATELVTESWELVAPVPTGARPKPTLHPRNGKPSACWVYRDPCSRLLGYICRFENEAGKTFAPLTLWRDVRSGKHRWRWRAWPAPRPLYGLDRLAANPDAPVVVCEGEKAADAAQALLLNWVSITSPNGSQSAKKTDWTPLLGKTVVVWPDNDAAGGQYAKSVAGVLTSICGSVSILQAPESAKEGWDAADALAECWSTDQIIELVASANTEADDSDAFLGAASRKKTTENRKGNRRHHLDALISLSDDMELWHAPDRTPFATFNNGSHRENCRITSEEFKRLLAYRSY